MTISRGIFGSLVVGCGLGLWCLTALVSGRAIESALWGQVTGRLAWGPVLFRTLLGLHGALLVAVGVYLARRRTLGPGLDSPCAGHVRTAPKWMWLALLGLAVVATGLRLWKLNSCLWFDEIDTLVNIVRQPWGRIVSVFPSQNQHMFYSLLAHASVGMFGESPAALRLPSVMFGIGSIGTMFLLGKHVVAARTALLASALLTVSYHHVWFSQNARGYMGLLFFTLLATWLWMEARARHTPVWWTAYAVSLALGTWMHMTMVFVAAAQFAVFVVFDLLVPTLSSAQSARSLHCKRLDWYRRLLPLGAWLLAGTLTLQLYALALPEFMRSALHEVSRPSEWTRPWWVLEESLRSLSRSGWAAGLAVGVGGALLVVGWVQLLVKDRRAALVMVLPGILAGGTMLALGHNLWPRFFFFCMGFAVLLAIHGVVQLPHLLPPRAPTPQRWRRRVGVGLAVLIVLASVFTLPRNYALPKQDFIGARDFVEQRRSPGEGVVAVGLAAAAYHWYYARHWPVAQTREELDGIIQADQSRLWLVYTLPIELRAYHPGIWQAVKRDFEVVKVFPGTLGDGAVTVCRRHSPIRETS